ncbi:2'-5' RNA ligase family protein [Coleofasciculus sp. LEGE 07081]|uniref:2'-5' RNA ligase family protein n=1 Tax=unclassified Coleofasciculus TaxID=2692782 RepID=UPI00187E6FC3|nr:2'-5' RNA ligase family protein [Coleofasciculus sp. LEGE 07081]MBE9128660.1 2'-5' RNA ligase family protein [Coleofasciculus sp. LEGE 07081]MBE9149745.1 2'-5' RNA ligase family protein [Coleofasciculus sp. LEGE 07092]
MKHRFFIALLPPQDIQDSITKIKQHFAQVYESKAALKSPPHITLQPPFEWQEDDRPTLEQSLKTFAQTKTPVPITLKGFGAFAPRVIYANILKTPELLAIQKDLMAYVEESLSIVHEVSKRRPFSPHITVGYSDLKRQQFSKAWSEFENRPLAFDFTAFYLTLLIHNGQQWTISAEFPLNS